MERITYTWRDLAICFRVALNLQRVLLGAAVTVLTLLGWWLACATSYAGMPFGLSDPAFEIPGVWQIPYLAALGVVWWAIVSQIWVGMLRGACIEISADSYASFKEVRVYAEAHGRYHFRAPFAVALYTLPLLLPLLGWVLLTYIPGVGDVIAAITSPIALLLGAGAGLVAVVGVLSLPLQAASVAMHGGDAYEGLSRAGMYATMAPQRYAMWYVAKLIMLALALVFAFAVLALGASVLCLAYGAIAGMAGAAELVDVIVGVMPASAAQHIDPNFALGTAIGVWSCGLLAVGYALSYDATSDLMVFLLMRHWCDGTPVSEYFSPVEAFNKRTSMMERKLAQQSVRPTEKVKDATAKVGAGDDA